MFDANKFYGSFTALWCEINKPGVLSTVVYEYETRKWHLLPNKMEKNGLDPPTWLWCISRLRALAMKNLQPTISCRSDHRTGYCVTVDTPPESKAGRIIYDLYVPDTAAGKVPSFTLTARHITQQSSGTE